VFTWLFWLLLFKGKFAVVCPEVSRTAARFLFENKVTRLAPMKSCEDVCKLALFCFGWGCVVGKKRHTGIVLLKKQVNTSNYNYRNNK